MPRAGFLGILVLVLSGSTATAGSIEDRASATIERHVTSNALDSDRNVADSYTVLQGSFAHVRRHEGGHVGVAAEIKHSFYDTVAIENDGALTLGVEAQQRIGERFELRGTLSYHLAKEGDDLSIGPFVIGTETLKHIAGAGVELGADLGSGMTLAVGLEGTLEKAGKTSFERGLIEPAKLEPDKQGFRLSATLARVFVDTKASALLAWKHVAVELIGDPPGTLPFDEATAAVGLRRVFKSGANVDMGLGIQVLKSIGQFTFVRPTYTLTVAQPLFGGRFELRGAVSAAFETVDTDDPLASWLQRLEIEARWVAAERLTFAAGAFLESRINLLLENREYAEGVYAEAVFAVTPALSLVLRADAERSRATIIDVRKRTLDAYVGLRTQL